MGNAAPNVVLRRCLDELGWKPEGLAVRVNDYARRQGMSHQIHIKTPYTWLLHGREPREPGRSLIAAVLSECLNRTVTITELGWEQPSAYERIPADWGLTTPPQRTNTLIHLEEIGSDNVDRRLFLTVSGAGLTATAHGFLLNNQSAEAATALPEVNSATLNVIDAATHQLRLQDDACGGGLAGQPARAQLANVVSLLKNGGHPPEIEKRLYQASAELSRISGWTLHDMGQDGAAQRAFLVGVRAAELGGRKELGANVLRSMAVQTVTVGNPYDAANLVTSAIQGADRVLTLPERVGMHTTLLKAHTATGEERLANQTMEKLRELTAKAGTMAPPPHMFWVEPAEVLAFTGSSDLHFGRLASAQQQLSQAIRESDPNKQREQGHWLCMLAQTHLKQGDVEQACVAGSQAIDRLAMVKSRRVHQHLTDLKKDLSVHKGLIVVRDFDEKMRTTFARA